MLSIPKGLWRESSLYNNLRRDFNGLCEKLGIEGFDGSFHAPLCDLRNMKNANPLVVQRQGLSRLVTDYCRAVFSKPKRNCSYKPAHIHVWYYVVAADPTFKIKQEWQKLNYPLST